MITIKSLLKLKLVYVVVFLSLAFWAIFAFYTMNQLISSQEGYAKIINISGKQRMLSQKTTLMAKRSFETNDKKLIKHTIELITLMKKDHAFLTSNLTSEHMKEIYFEQEHRLNKRVKGYFKLFDEFLNNMNEKTLKEIENYSFKLLPELNYAVNEFEKESNEKTEQLRNRESFILMGTLITLILEALFIVIPSIRFSERSEKQLKDLNKNLERKVEEELAKLREKDKIINEQSKMITMREVLNNIAHQWRQPLSIMTTSASGLKLQKEYDQLSDENFNKELDMIIENGEYLSKTIDKFRSFFEEEKEKTIYTLEDIYKKSLDSIIHRTSGKEIIFIPKIEDISYSGSENRLLNVIEDIFNNSIDEFENIDTKKYIFTNIYKNDEEIKIEITDNAGGIKEDIIEKIFEPYFTTKHKSIGKGMDLYIAKETIEKIFNGTIVAENSTFEYEGDEYTGAKLTINFPIKF